MKKIVVVGAGFGGLSIAAELSRLGFEVTVFEAHVYPGGSAGTFYHQGYQFEAGATLAGVFGAAPPQSDMKDTMDGAKASLVRKLDQLLATRSPCRVSQDPE